MMIEVAAGLIRNSLGQLLLAQTLPEHPLKGQWEFPGGKQEPGEPLEQTLSRELQEEFGLEISRIELFTSVQHSYDYADIHLHGFLAQAQSEVQKVTSHQTYAWVPVTAIHRYPLAPADQALFDRFLA